MRREGGEAVAEVFDLGRVGGLGSDEVGLDQKGAGVVELMGLGAGVALEFGAHEVGGDGTEPGAEGGAGREAGDVPKGEDKGLVGEFVHEMRLRQPQGNVGADVVEVGVHEGLEGGGVAGLNGADEIGFGGRGRRLGFRHVELRLFCGYNGRAHSLTGKMTNGQEGSRVSGGGVPPDFTTHFGRLHPKKRRVRQA